MNPDESDVDFSRIKVESLETSLSKERPKVKQKTKHKQTKRAKKKIR